MTSLYFIFLACRLSIHSHFHHPDMCFFKLRLYVFISCYARMLMFCSLYVFGLFIDSGTFPFQPFFLLGCLYLFVSFHQITYFRFIVGKSTPFSIILESLVSLISPIFRGYAFFLVVIAYSIFIIKIYRKIQSYLNSNEHISLQNVNFCMCIYLLYFFLFTITILLSS
jgi:hypothetical protein